MRLTRFFVFVALMELLPIATVYPVMLVDEGLTTTQIGIAIAAWSIASGVLEVPSGAVADRFDRRRVLAFGQVLVAAGLAVWLVAPTAAGFTAGLAIWGAGSAFHSGTLESFVHDEAVAAGRAHDFSRLLGRTEAVILVSAASSGGIAALLAHAGWGYRGLVAASVVVALVAAGVVLTVPAAERTELPDDAEPDDAEPTGDEPDGGYLALLRAGVAEVWQVRRVGRAVLAVVLAGVVVDVVSEYAPLFSTDAGLQTTGVAVVGGVTILLMAAGGMLAGRLPPGRFPAAVAVPCAGLAVLVAAVADGLPTLVRVALIGLAAVFAQMASIVSIARMHAEISGRARATTASVAGLGQEAGNVGALITFGLVADGAGRGTAFAVLGAVLLLPALLVPTARLAARGSARSLHPPQPS